MAQQRDLEAQVLLEIGAALATTRPGESLPGGTLVDARQYSEAILVNQQAAEVCREVGSAEGVRLAVKQLGIARQALR
ncbi:hypothetical protein [Kitasatospora acidiphila]|uniref:hypothetical protein n=1 Tax=Kitasatospora acidiphila TaxID=2567942 RepID=UPI003C735BC7